MTEIDPHIPGPLKAPVFYIRPDPLYEAEKPYFMNIPVTYMKGLKQTNVSYTMRMVSFHDIRGNESHYTVDKQGFALGNMRTSLAYEDFEDPKKITTVYFQEVRNFLKKSLGASYVLPWDYQVRRRNPDLPQNDRGVPGKAQPFGAVHADQTTQSALRRLAYFHPEEAARHSDDRVQIINVWRPLFGPVYDAPLAVCDYRSVNANDAVPTDAVFPDYLGETYNFYPNPEHRWFYIDGQKAEEAWMVKCFDSAALQDPSVSKFCPHVAFPFVNPPANVKPRESIEVRAYVFYTSDDQTSEVRK